MFGFPDITTAIESGTTNPWLLLPVGVALGALHALEPGHSKSLMAGFIVAAKGTTAMAVATANLTMRPSGIVCRGLLL